MVLNQAPTEKDAAKDKKNAHGTQIIADRYVKNGPASLVWGEKNRSERKKGQPVCKIMECGHRDHYTVKKAGKALEHKALD